LLLLQSVIVVARGVGLPAQFLVPKERRSDRLMGRDLPLLAAARVFSELFPDRAVASQVSFL